MTKKTIVLLAALIGLWSCFAASPDKTYYHLKLVPAPVEAPSGRSLLIDRIDIASLYDDFRIVYRLSPFEINYYSYHFWTEKPSRMLQFTLRNYLEDSKRFAKVLTETAKEDPDWILRCSVYQIEEVDERNSWSARLGMKIELAEFKSGRVLASRRFDRKEALVKKDVGLVAAALSRILGEELAALFADVKY